VRGVRPETGGLPARAAPLVPRRSLTRAAAVGRFVERRAQLAGRHARAARAPAELRVDCANDAQQRRHARRARRWEEAPTQRGDAARGAARGGRGGRARVGVGVGGVGVARACARARRPRAARLVHALARRPRKQRAVVLYARGEQVGERGARRRRGGAAREV
jgi:hypothetical protein